MRDATARLPVGAARWDLAGIVVSAACAIHCLALPLLAGLLPFVELHRFADGRVEWLFIMTTAVVGLVSHTRAYLRYHRHVAPGLLFAAGVLLVLAVRSMHFEGVAAPISAAIAGAFTIMAHALNLRLCRCCQSCSDHACGEREDV
jgi:hypothetical protein